MLAAMLVAALAGTARAETPPTAAPPSEMATIVDTAAGGSAGSALGAARPRPSVPTAAFFVLKRVNGEDLRTGIDASLAASRGLGRSMRVVLPEHSVKAGKSTLRLLASVVHAVPIESMFARSSGFVAEGEIEVDLKAGVRYRVTGALDDFKREVWLEEEATGWMVGKKIVQSPSPEAMAAMATADRYTCCNLRYDGDWISDNNFIGQPFIPAGSRVKVAGWGRKRVHVNIEGRTMSAGPDSDFEPLTREQFADRIFVKEDPKTKVEGYSPEVQQAIVSGRVLAWMTREQVVMAIGFPRADRTEGGLGGKRWVYSLAEEGDEFDLDFDGDGKLVAVNASSRVRRSVVHNP
jgi:hypothetical protein